MKRIFFIFTACLTIIGMQFLINCSNPLEIDDGAINNPPPPDVDTIVLTDTIYIYDSTLVNDTVFIIDSSMVIDTITIIDTVYSTDTVFTIDSFYVLDSFFIFDTTFISDTIYEVDTTVVYDTVINTDTLYIVDTTNTVDTITIIDSIIFTDTVIVVDTLAIDTLIVVDTTIQTDTIFVFDTTTVVDTVYIEIVDTAEVYSFCSRLSGHLKDIVWMFTNTEGDYVLEFSSNAEPRNPERIMTMTIDGVVYTWNPYVDATIDIEQFLNEDAVITIVPNKPPANGHELDICLTIRKE